MLKNVTCYVWALFIGIVMTSDIKGMKRTDTITEKQLSSPSTFPIDTAFPCFLNSNSSRVPANWPRALDNISPIVSYLVANQSVEDLDVTYCAIIRICSYSFKDFCRFCLSEYCDTTYRKSVINLLILTLAVLQKVQPTEATIQASKDLKLIIGNAQEELNPIISDANSEFFGLVADILADL